MRFKGMSHIALTVDDVERSARFYEQGFGMRRFGPAKHNDTLVPLVSPGLRDQISLSSPDAAGELDRDSGVPGDRSGIDHFGFVVAPGTSLDRLRAHLESCGATFLGRVDVEARVPSLFFRDLDGYVFQVTRFPRFTKLYVAVLPLMQWWEGRRARQSAVVGSPSGADGVAA